MRKLRALPLIAASTLLGTLSALPVAAQTTTYGTPIAGTGPSGDYGTLVVSQTGSDDWSFSFTAGDLSSLLGSAGSFIGSLAVDVLAPVGNFGSGLALTDVGGGVGSVTAANGGGPGGAFDFRLNFGGGGDRLTSGETVTWTWANSGITAFDSFALHVQGLEGNPNGYSGSLWVGPGPVPAIPEPASVAMLLAGLAGLGAVTRRRRQSRG